MVRLDDTKHLRTFTRVRHHIVMKKCIHDVPVVGEDNQFELGRRILHFIATMSSKLFQVQLYWVEVSLLAFLGML